MANQVPEELLNEVRDRFNELFSNMFTFDDNDMADYDRCYSEVFKDGIPFSYMSSTFYAQFAAELLLGALASNPFRRFLANALEDEAKRTEPGVYWEPSMNEKRFGLEGVDYSGDMADLMQMMNVSYLKIASMNNWYGSEDGKKEFELFCLSVRAVRDIKKAIMQFPYLIRRYDYDRQFAGEIMEYAGIVSAEIRRSAEEDD